MSDSSTDAELKLTMNEWSVRFFDAWRKKTVESSNLQEVFPKPNPTPDVVPVDGSSDAVPLDSLRREKDWIIPDEIVVGPFYFRVVYEENLRAEGGIGMRLAGQVDNVNTIIRIDPEMSKSKQFETLWHEILHSISHLTDETMDEKAVSLIAPYVCAVLNQNPTVRSCVP